MPGKCCFRESWITSTCDDGDNLSFWLRPVKNDKYKAYCSTCKSTFDVSHSGFNAIKTHVKGKKHKALFGTLHSGKQSCLNFSKTNDKDVESSSSLSNKELNVEHTLSCTSVEEKQVGEPYPKTTMSKFLMNDAVLKAEILWALNKVFTHTSDRGSSTASDLFSLMFPDSLIANKFQMQKDKLGYVVSFGLGPYFQEKLCDNLKKCEFFSISIDESLNSVAQKKQLDFIVKYWNDDLCISCTRYLTSAFLGHSTAADLLSFFSSTLNELGLCASKILQIGIDGPNVNIKFIRDFKSMMKETLTDTSKEMIDIGTCSLHTVHNAYKTSHNKSKWNIHKFLRSIYYLFKNFPSRRSDYTNASGSTLFPLKLCTIRWIENVGVIERALKILPFLKKYIEFVENHPPETDNFTVVKEFLKDTLLEAKLSFLQSVAMEIEPFLKIYQTDSPMLPFLYNDLYLMLKSLGNRFIATNVMKQIKNCSQLLKVDVTKPENVLNVSQIDVGFGAKKYSKNVKELDVQLFRRDSCQFLKNLFLKLIGPKCPLHKRLVKGASCLSPVVMLSDSLRMQRMTIALEELSMTDHISSVEADTIKKYYASFCEDLTVVDKLKTFSLSENRIDSFLFEILCTRSEQCKPMYLFCKLIFSMFHGNAAVERGFSINKECLVENLSERSLISQRSVYSAIASVGGVKNIEITPGLLQAVKLSSSRRKMALEEKKSQQLKDALGAKAAFDKINELKLKKRNLLLQAEEEVAAIQKEIDLAKKKVKI